MNAVLRLGLFLVVSITMSLGAFERLGFGIPGEGADQGESTLSQLAGTVVDDKNNPLAEFTVRAECETFGSHWRSEPQVTDQNGAFTLSVSIGHTYTVSAYRPGYDESFLIGVSQVLRRVSCGTKDLSFVFTRPSCISGIVRTARNEIPGEFRVRFLGGVEDTTGEHHYFGGTPYELRVAKDGAFEICGIVAKWGKIIANCDEMAWGESDVLRFDPNNTQENVRVTIESGSTVRGRVVDADGAGIGGAGIEIFDANFVPLHVLQSNAEVEQLVSGSDGSFSIDHVAPGRFSVRCSRTGYIPLEPVEFLVARTPEVSIPAIRFVAKTSGMTGTIRKTLGGPPATDVEVSILRISGPPCPSYWVHENKDGRSDTDGKFVLQDLFPGKYVLIVKPLPNWQNEREYTVELIAGKEREILVAMGPGIIVSGSVAGGSPAERLQIELVPEAPEEAPLGGAALIRICSSCKPDSEYSIGAVPRGRYKLGVCSLSPPSPVRLKHNFSDSVIEVKGENIRIDVVLEQQ